MQTWIRYEQYTLSLYWCVQIQARRPLHRMLDDQGSEVLVQEAKKEKHQHAFLDMLVHQQSDMGKYSHWPLAYRKRCDKKNVKAPV